jgi:hypothetical protein
MRASLYRPDRRVTCQQSTRSGASGDAERPRDAGVNPCPSAADTSGMNTADLATLDDGALADRLARFEDDERRLSRRRTSLHDRIDFLARGGYAHEEQSEAQLTALRAEERALSDERHHVHEAIAAARAELVRRRG